MSLNQVRTALAVVLLTPTLLTAQQRALTIDDLYDPDRRINFSGNIPSGLRWIDDAHYLQRGGQDPSGSRLLKVDAVTGVATPLVDVERFEQAITRLPGTNAGEARRISRSASHTLNPTYTGLVFTLADDLYYYSFGSDRVRRLTHTTAPEEEVAFSPDGRLLAFVRAFNLHVVDVDERVREYPLTTNGTAELLNGKLDWVYQEEIYGRGNYRGYWWSPDSSRLAYLQLDERPVPEFAVVDHIPYRLSIETWDYPKAGDPNPAVRLGLVRTAGGPTVWVRHDDYAGDILIADVAWSKDGRRVVYQVQNREQTWLDLRVADAESGESTRLFRETTMAWVDVTGSPHWLADGSFLWLSERTGWKHIYHYGSDGLLKRQITAGQWEVRTLHGVDERTGWVYFSGTERSHIGGDVYRIHLDGTGLTRLSERPGAHTATFNPSLTRYLGTWSDVTTTPQIRLHAADGAEVRVVADNPVRALDNYRLSTPEFVQVKTRDGFVMEAMLIKPPDFDPSRTYPVYQGVYGGPHAQRVRNAWNHSEGMFFQLLAQRGILVWVCDNRTASGKGAQSTWPLYRNFGELELRDIEDCLGWLKQQPYVDARRIGIEGWSYGGYMVSYALTHSQSFVMGIAGGPVTDWRDYDTIYTERYMLMPQNNPEGYRKSSPRFDAANLHGALLLIHGTIDDNVHVQNTLQFAYELQRAGKPFELMLYPKSRHHLTDPLLEKHLRSTMLDFAMRHLTPASSAATRTSGAP